MGWNLLKKVSEAVVEAAKFCFIPHLYQADSQEEYTSAILASNNALVEQREAMQLAKLKLQYIQKRERKDFQQQQVNLPDERAKKLQEFILQVEEIRLQKNLYFQQWRLEQEKALQLQLIKGNRELQRKLAVDRRQISLNVIEEQKKLDNSPFWLVISEIINSPIEDEIIPLRVFFTPPKKIFEQFADASNNSQWYPNLELTLAEGLRQFFRNYSRQRRTIDFLAGTCLSNSFHSEASIKALFGILKAEPTLVLESEVDGEFLNFRVAYWSLNCSNYRYEPVISRLPYKDILYEAAKTRARKWLDTRAKLIAVGEKPEDVDKLYGQDNVKNLEVLQQEERFKEAGIDTSELELNYIVNKKDFEGLCQFLIIYHCLFAGLMADEYFLLQYNLPPLLPQLLPELIQNIPDTEAVEEMIQSVVLYYKKIYLALETQKCAFLPELALDLALSLAHLSNKAWAKSQVIYSGQLWLKLHGLPYPVELEPLLEAVESALTIGDLAYVQKLNDCVAAIGENRCLSVMYACYNRGMNRFQQNDYEAAICDFDQAIQLNPQWVEAYCNRGLIYAKLEEYHKAIEDYSQALRLNPRSAVVFSNRGNAYYKLGNYEQAIADYDQALHINPNLVETVRTRDIVRGVWDELRRKQQEEEECKSKLANASVTYTLTDHSDFVRCLAISPDGQTFVSSGDDMTIKIWQLSTGRQLRTLTGHYAKVSSVAISPDGQTLASCSWDDSIKIWQVSTGQTLRTLTGHNCDVNCLAISPDGQILVSGSDNNIKVWQLSTGQELLTLKGHSGYVHCVAISPDGQTLVSGSSDKTIKIWQLSTGRELHTLTRHSYSIYALAISPDGQTLVSGSGDKTIRMWQLSNGQELRTLTGHSNSVCALAISSDGQRLVSGSYDNTIKIWHLGTGLVQTLRRHSNYVYALAISPDGQTIVSGSADKTIKVWRSQREP